MKRIKLFEDKFKKEAEQNDIFGSYLFADQRKGMKRLEPNKYQEDKFFSDLDSHYGGDMIVLSKWIPKMRKLKNDKKYKNFLIPPKGKVWRLLTGVNDSTIKKMLGMNSHQLLEHENNFHKVSNITIKPIAKKNQIQSWTYILEYKTFQNITIDNEDNFLILESDAHNPKNEFFLNYEAIKSLEELPNYVKKEAETISYGDVFCDNVYFWIRTSDKTINDIERQIKTLNIMISNLENKLWDSSKEKSKEIKLKIKELEKIKKEKQEYLNTIYDIDVSDNITKLIKLIKKH